MKFLIYVKKLKSELSRLSENHADHQLYQDDKQKSAAAKAAALVCRLYLLTDKAA